MIAVEELVEDVAFWEVLVDEVEEFSAHIGGYMLAEGGIVPYNIAFAFGRSRVVGILVISRLVELQDVVMASFFEGILVGFLGAIELVNVT